MDLAAFFGTCTGYLLGNCLFLLFIHIRDRARIKRQAASMKEIMSILREPDPVPVTQGLPKVVRNGN